MGPVASKDSKHLEQLHSRFNVVRELTDRNVSYLEEKQTHRPYLLKQVTFNDHEQFNRAVSKVAIKQKELEGQPHVVPLTEYFVKTEDNFCSNFYKLYVLFEHPHKTLNDEIAERQERNSRFQEKELWSILASCILGLCHLQNADIKHQALRSDTILLAAEGSILVADPYCTSEQTNYETLLNKRNTQHIYLSPELCQALHDQKLNPTNVNPFKSDVFTMGMIMLEAGLLSYQDDCYRQDCSKVHWETLQYNLERFGQIYSNELKAMLEMMLNQNDDERLVWVELETYVRSGDQSESIERIQTPVARQSEPRVDRPVASHENSTHPQEPNSAPQGTANSSATIPQPQRSMYRQLGGGGAHNNVSKFQQPQPSDPNLTSNIHSNPPTGKVTQSTVPPHQQFISHAVGVFHSQGPSTNSQESGEGPKLVQPSLVSSVKPQFNQHLPTNVYNTLTKLDENLVEIDEEDLTQTRDPDEQKDSMPLQNNPPASNILNHTSNFNDTATLRQYIPAAPNQMYVSAPPVQLPSNGYQFASVPTFHLLQQPTEAQKFANWQSSVVPNPGLATSNQSYQSMPPPVSISQAGSIPLGATFRPPQPPPTIVHTYQAPIAYQSSYVSPTNYASAQPPASNYPPPTFSSRPAPFDYTGARTVIGQNQFNNYQPQQPKTYDIPTVTNQGRFNDARFTESFDANSTHRALNEPQVQFVKETFKQGSYYEGEKVNGMRHGHGKFYYTDGGLYDGEWRENKMSGQGKLYYQSGKIAYDGAWSDDKFTGFGILYNEVPLPMDGPLEYNNFEQVDEYWTKFEGEFFDDLKQGPGRLSLSNGEYFQGQFDKDTATGEGCYHRMTGEKVRGYWNQNQLVKRFN